MELLIQNISGVMTESRSEASTESRSEERSEVCTVTGRKTRVKGFTLVELIVVLAIIGVLMTMISLAIMGFVNDAKRETADDNARMIYQGVQNYLTQCEIAGFNLNAGVDKPLKIKFGTGENDVTYLLEKSTTVDADKSKSYLLGDSFKRQIKRYSDGTNPSDPSDTIIVNNSDEAMTAVYNEIARNFEPGFSGSFYVRLDCFTYTVQYVLFTELTAEKDGNDFALGYLDPEDADMCGQLADRATQKKILKEKGVVIGCYPYISDITEATTTATT